MSRQQQQQQQQKLRVVGGGGRLDMELGGPRPLSPIPSWLSGSVRELEDEIDRFTNRVQLVRSFVRGVLSFLPSSFMSRLLL